MSGFSGGTEKTHAKPSKICMPPNSQKEVLLSILSQRWVIAPDKLRFDKHAKKLLAFVAIPR
jgi:hypothetical protein